MNVFFGYDIKNITAWSHGVATNFVWEILERETSCHSAQQCGSLLFCSKFFVFPLCLLYRLCSD